MPQARAVFPETLVYVPGRRAAGFTSYADSKISAVSPKFQPALNASVLASRTISLLAKRLCSHSSVGSPGRPYIHDTSPKAKKFLERSASRALVPLGFTACMVSEVIGIS